MTPQQREWLDANREHLLDAQVPALSILDFLVAREIFDTRRDDYQTIVAQDTPHKQIRALLDALKSKSKAAFTAFITALETHCLHALKECKNLPDVIRQFDSEVRMYYRTLDEEEMLAFSWLERTSSRIKISDYLRHLAVIDKRQNEALADSDNLASSAKELERHQQLHSRPAEKIELVELENIFGEEPRAPRNRVGVDDDVSSDPQAGVATSSGKATSGDVVLGEREAHVPLWKQPRKRVGVYGAAGCGKTASLMKLACLYARGKLWQDRFRSFLFWRLRDRDVARAETFEQLLKTLPFDPSPESCKAFAEAASACRGRGLLVALDGIDELARSTGEESFVRRLLEGDELREACVLVTSRPCNQARSFFRTYDTNLELLGFREEQVTEFVQQRLGHKPELISRLEDVLARNASMASMMNVPLLAFLICDVFSASSKNPPTTRSQLYSRLVTLVVQRAVAEGRVRLPDDGDEEDEESDLQDARDVRQIGGTAKKLLLEMAKVAWEAMKEDSAIFGHALIRKVGCSSKALELGLLAFDRRVVEEHSVAVRQYSFHHMTVQEFLVALLLVEQTGDSEEKLREMLGNLEMGPHQFVVIQFLAGLLPDRLLPTRGLARLFPARLLPAQFHPKTLRTVLFSFLNTFLHHNWNMFSAECADRLRLCLQCVREAYVGGKTFPHTLQLPKKVSLEHVSAADMELLSSSLDKCPSSLEELELFFDSVEGEAEKFTRVQTQTRNALERLMAVLSVCKSIRVLVVYGPFYKLFTEESWRCLVKIGHNNPLQKLSVWQCLLDDDDVCELASELQHCTQLSGLYLHSNMIGDRGVRRLADSLKHIHTLRWLNLRLNSCGQDSRDFLTQQLKHIPVLYV